MRKETWALLVVVACAVSAAITLVVTAQEGDATTNAPSAPLPDVVSTTVAPPAVSMAERLVEPVKPSAVPQTVVSETTNGLVDIAVAAPETAAGGAASSAAGRITFVTVEPMPVPDFINFCSQFSGANIISAGVFTNIYVTANLRNVEWRDALRQVLASVDLTMIEDPGSGIVMVTTRDQADAKRQLIDGNKPLVTRTILVRYLNPVDLVEQIKLMGVLSPRGRIITSQSRDQNVAYLKSSNLETESIQNPSIVTEIIVTDIREYADHVEDLIKKLDRREPQVYIEGRIIDVVDSDSTKLGFDWEMLDSFGASLGLSDLSWSFTDTKESGNAVNESDAIINADSKFDNRSSADTVDKFYDINTRQYEVTDPDTGDVVPTRSLSEEVETGRNVTSDKTYQNTKTYTKEDAHTVTKMGTATLTASEASLFLSALQRTGKANMLSHPVIIVGNRVEAKIHIGDRYPTIQSLRQAANPQTGQTEGYSESVEWNDLGLTLWVIPEIDRAADVVRMTLNPQMSTHVKDITTSAGSVYPVISTRQVSTRVNVPNKQTVVIGGLIQNSKEKNEKRVPILGDIPLLGLLFRHQEDTVEKQNLLILLTPTILDDRAPLTGLEGMAMQVAEELEKIPQAARKAGPTNDIIKTVAAPGEANKAKTDEPVPVLESSAEPASEGAPPGNGAAPSSVPVPAPEGSAPAPAPAATPTPAQESAPPAPATPTP